MDKPVFTEADVYHKRPKSKAGDPEVPFSPGCKVCAACRQDAPTHCVRWGDGKVEEAERKPGSSPYEARVIPREPSGIRAEPIPDISLRLDSSRDWTEVRF